MAILLSKLCTFSIFATSLALQREVHTRAAATFANALKAVSFGNSDCPCIGITGSTGTVNVTIGDGLAVYPSDVGARCAAWDDGIYPKNCEHNGEPGKGKGWCAQKWCYVDPCSCSLTAKKAKFTKDATFQGKPLYYSYETCGSEDQYTMAFGKPTNKKKAGASRHEHSHKKGSKSQATGAKKKRADGPNALEEDVTNATTNKVAVPKRIVDDSVVEVDADGTGDADKAGTHTGKIETDKPKSQSAANHKGPSSATKEPNKADTDWQAPKEEKPKQTNAQGSEKTASVSGTSDKGASAHQPQQKTFPDGHDANADHKKTSKSGENMANTFHAGKDKKKHNEDGGWQVVKKSIGKGKAVGAKSDKAKANKETVSHGGDDKKQWHEDTSSQDAKREEKWSAPTGGKSDEAKTGTEGDEKKQWHEDVSSQDAKQEEKWSTPTGGKSDEAKANPADEAQEDTVNVDDQISESPAGKPEPKSVPKSEEVEDTAVSSEVEGIASSEVISEPNVADEQEDKSAETASEAQEGTDDDKQNVDDQPDDEGEKRKAAGGGDTDEDLEAMCGVSSDAKITGKDGCMCIGIKSEVGALPVSIASNITTYPVDVGASCAPWDKDIHPECIAGAGDDEDSSVPDWCKESWCYVDPCSCNQKLVRSGGQHGYVPKGSFQGRPLHYSYKTCGSADLWTSENNKDACLNKEESDCSGECSWVGNKCTDQEVASLCAAEQSVASGLESKAALVLGLMALWVVLL